MPCLSNFEYCLQADIKKRIAKWKNQSEAAKKRGGKRTDPTHIPREGAAQVVLWRMAGP